MHEILLELRRRYGDAHFTARMAANEVGDGRVVIPLEIRRTFRDIDLATALGRRFSGIEGQRFVDGGTWVAVRRCGYHSGRRYDGSSHATLWTVETGNTDR